jgi:hypothetical protein
MAENRLNRDLDTREKTTRRKAWVRPEVLPTPNPEQGYDFRWVRVSTRGESDPANVSMKLREGWEPVKASDHPEVFISGSEDPRFKDAVMMGGLMLCKAPTELVEDRNGYYLNQAEQNMRSVDNNLMRENDPRMPLFNERKSKVVFGQGS